MKTTTAKRFVKPLCLILEGERHLVRAIVARAAARGVSVNVDNGDDCDLLATDTTDFETVWKSLKSTGGSSGRLGASGVERLPGADDCQLLGERDH